MSEEINFNTKPASSNVEPTATEIKSLKPEKSNFWKFLIALAAIILLVVAGYWLWNNRLSPEARETWAGFYYPNRSDLTRHIQSGELESLEECRFWVNAQVTTFNPSDSGYDYECGKNCRFNKDINLYVCKETVR